MQGVGKRHGDLWFKGAHDNFSSKNKASDNQFAKITRRSPTYDSSGFKSTTSESKLSDYVQLGYGRKTQSDLLSSSKGARSFFKTGSLTSQELKRLEEKNKQNLKAGKNKSIEILEHSTSSRSSNSSLTTSESISTQVSTRSSTKEERQLYQEMNRNLARFQNAKGNNKKTYIKMMDKSITGLSEEGKSKILEKINSLSKADKAYFKDILSK